MTHYTISYAGNPNKQRDACRDTANYIGFRNMRAVVKACKAIDNVQHLRYLRMVLSFRLGVQGYPTTALFERYIPNYDASAPDDALLPVWDACDAA